MKLNEGPFETLAIAVKLATIKNCDWAEFGTATGNSTKVIYDLMPVDTHLHLFDSFEGLPESWLKADGSSFVSKGEFKVDPPKWIFNNSRITVHKGMFKDTIPTFVNEQKKCLGFVNIDCDLYSSTKTVFDNIDKLIVKGTIIHFDEFFNYPAWKLHEFKAFNEYVDKYNRSYGLLGRSDREQAWIRMRK